MESQKQAIRLLAGFVVFALPAAYISFSVAGGQQNQSPAQLFSAMTNENPSDQTPEASRRLSLLRQLPSTKSIEVVRLNSAVPSRGQFWVLLPGEKSLAYSKSAGDNLGAEAFTWLGTAGNGRPESTTLVVRNGEIAGSFVTPDGAYRIVPLGGRLHALVGIDASKLPKDEPESFRRIELAAMPPTRPVAAVPNPSNPVEIDVLVAYTPAAKAKVVDIDLTIDEAIAEANQSYQLSNVHIHLNRVDSFEVPYVEKNKSYDEILDFFSKDAAVNRHRDQSGADLAALFVDQPEYCGLSAAILAKPATAFSAIYFDCAIAPRYSLAHEFGHLLGAHHDEHSDKSPGYGHGYLYVGSNTSWRTIMANPCPKDCPRIPRWSNPRLSYQGISTGTTSLNDNARMLNEEAATIAAFRSRP